MWRWKDWLGDKFLDTLAKTFLPVAWAIHTDTDKRQNSEWLYLVRNKTWILLAEY